MSRARSLAIPIAAALVAGRGLAGCEAERIDPAPGAGGAGASGTTTTTSASGGGGAAPVKRTVIERSPFGNVARSDNLLWDGDFEWLSLFADQYGWLTGQGPYLSYALPTAVLGARCKSGIKCAEMAPGDVLVGVGVASAGHALEVSFWAAPAAGGCDAVQAVLLTEDQYEPQASVLPESQAPQDGWCRFAATVAERHSAPWLYLENVSSDAVLVDDAVLCPVASSASRTRAASGPDPAAGRDLGWLRRQVREHLKPRIVPDNPVRTRLRRAFGQPERTE